MTEQRLQLAILFGGRSVEHDISVLSATNVASHIDREQFDVTLLGIDKQGGWYCCQDTQGAISEGTPVNLVLQGGKGAFAERQSGQTLPDFDIVFPVLHGTDGEDGSVQGLLKAANIPFVGCGVLSSAMSMSKLVTKRLLAQAGVNIGKYCYYTRQQQDSIHFAEVEQKLGLPMIVKPANLGSSVGVHKINKEADFAAALADCFRYDQEVLIEEFITGREMECAVMGNADAQASQAGEIIVQGHEFYSFEAKYVDAGGSRLIIPAETEAELLEEIKKQSIMAYKALFCEDLARIDLFVTAAGKVYINEINTIPGFTNISMYPKLWELEGISYPQLITKLVALALEKYEEQRQLQTNFESALS